MPSTGTGVPLLNTHSVILCPHGGIVQHTPTTFTSYRVAGRRPMLLTDIYQIVGCPFYAGFNAPCQFVTWVTGSSRLFVRGIPVLTQTSVGLCTGSYGAGGPAIITQCQLMEMEPGEVTFINS